MRKSLYVFLLFCFLPSIMAESYLPQTVPNPKTGCVTCFVANPDAIISETDVAVLNRKLQNLEAETGVEIAVVALSSISDDYDEYGFAYELFNSWKVGKKGKDNGILLLFVKDIRAVKIETGYGVEGLLTDAFCDRVLNEKVFPIMRTGDYGQGINVGIDAFCARLTTDESKKELLFTPSKTSKAIDAVSNYFVISIIAFLLMLLLVYNKMNKLTGDNNLKYISLRSIMRQLAFASILFPLPMAFLALWLRFKRRKIRTQPFACSCGATMHLLSEQDEDAYLSFEQTIEDNLKSIDYDVWICHKCKKVQIFPYENLHTKYSRCPHCNSKTYLKISDEVVLSPTSLNNGQGRKTYYCKACKYKNVINYLIPKTGTPIIVGGGHGFGGGSLGGGSFGGGLSGGGGGGGRF